MSLFPRQIVAPVIRVEESKGEGESYPGDDVDFLSLEMEIPVPLDQRVGLPGWAVAVDDWARWRWWIVGTVAALNITAGDGKRNKLSKLTFTENPPSSSLSASRTSFSISFSFFSLCFSLLCSSDLQERIKSHLKTVWGKVLEVV